MERLMRSSRPGVRLTGIQPLPNVLLWGIQWYMGQRVRCPGLLTPHSESALADAVRPGLQPCV
jgi:hypothetical protein